MARLRLSLRGEGPVTLDGPRAKLRDLYERIRDAMAGSADTVITHDLAGEPRSFLCSEIVDLHEVEDD